MMYDVLDIRLEVLDWSAYLTVSTVPHFRLNISVDIDLRLLRENLKSRGESTSSIFFPPWPTGLFELIDNCMKLKMHMTIVHNIGRYFACLQLLGAEMTAMLLENVDSHQSEPFNGFV